MVMWEEKWTLKLAWGAACGATASERAPSGWRMPHLEPRFGIIILPETRAATQTKKAAEKMAYLLELLDGTGIDTAALVDQVWRRVSV